MQGQHLPAQKVGGGGGLASTWEGSAGGGWVSGGVVGLELRVESLGHRPAHVLDQAQLHEDPDQTSGGVELDAEYAVARAGWVGVVQVVPGLAAGRDRQRSEDQQSELQSLMRQPYAGLCLEK